MNRRSLWSGFATLWLLGVVPLAATSANFHLSESGLCNETDAAWAFKLDLRCNDSGSSCDKCRMENTTNFDSKDGGTLQPGECATASFYLEAGTKECQADLDVWYGEPNTDAETWGRCEFQFALGEIDLGGDTDLDGGDRCDPPGRGSHGDKHFQVTLK